MASSVVLSQRRVGDGVGVYRAYLGATSCCNNTADLTGFAEAFRWIIFVHSVRRTGADP